MKFSFVCVFVCLSREVLFVCWLVSWFVGLFVGLLVCVVCWFVGLSVCWFSWEGNGGLSFRDCAVCLFLCLFLF